MTRRQFRQSVGMILAFYALALILGACLYFFDPSAQNPWFGAFKDLLSLIITLPAAYLAYCIQQRSSFLQTLRAAWSNLVRAVNGAILYAQRPAPEPKEYYDLLAALRVAIDDLRGVYRNVGESDAGEGLYPVSPLLDIYDRVAALQTFGPLPAEEAAARKALSEQLFGQWKNVRGVLLYELDRPEPSAADIRRMLPDASR